MGIQFPQATHDPGTKKNPVLLMGSSLRLFWAWFLSTGKKKKKKRARRPKPILGSASQFGDNSKRPTPGCFGRRPGVQWGGPGGEKSNTAERGSNPLMPLFFAIDLLLNPPATPNPRPRPQPRTTPPTPTHEPPDTIQDPKG